MVLPDSYLGSEQGHKQAPEQSAFECLQFNATITEFTRNLLLHTRLMSLHKRTNMYKIPQRVVVYRAYTITAWNYQNQNCYGTMLAASWATGLKDRWSCREISTTTIKGNTTMSAVITSWESLTKWQTITFITNGSDELPWLPTEFISSQQWVR